MTYQSVQIEQIILAYRPCFYNLIFKETLGPNWRLPVQDVENFIFALTTRQYNGS